MEASARTLYHSLQRVRDAAGLAADLAGPRRRIGVRQGHQRDSRRARSATSGASTGRFASATKSEFVARVLAGQPEPPTYFAEMKRVNSDGPRDPRTASGGRRRSTSTRSTPRSAAARSSSTRGPPATTRVGHVPGHDQHPAQRRVSRRGPAGCVPYTARLLLIVDATAAASIDRAVRDLAMIGLDRVAGVLRRESSIDAWAAAGRRARDDPADRGRRISRESLAHGGVTLVDVRGDNEWRAGHIAGARHIPLGYLTDAPRRGAARIGRSSCSARPAAGRRLPPACCARTASSAVDQSRRAASTSGSARDCRSTRTKCEVSSESSAKSEYAGHGERLHHA